MMMRTKMVARAVHLHPLQLLLCRPLSLVCHPKVFVCRLLSLCKLMDHIPVML